jgi:hypothetical protein
LLFKRQTRCVACWIVLPITYRREIQHSPGFFCSPGILIEGETWRKQAGKRESRKNK